jgi:ribonuclease HII
MRPKILIGVDEAGRAPLAGPVSVGCVAVARGFDVAREFKGVRDSKKLSPENREEIYEALVKRKKLGDVSFCVRFSEAAYIDRFGITRAVRRAIMLALHSLAPSPEGVSIQLDGLLHAPSRYQQETIIRGDDLVPLISLTSVAAKVERDRLMVKMAKKFPHWGFERHKGYPTKAHYGAIERYGLCEIHRRSFCKKLVFGI